jgi:hypothetical protein
MTSCSNWSQIRAGLLALVVLACAALGTRTAAAAPSTFDHFTTGFELLGQHGSVPCADCHVAGIFKGTPTDCFACHSPGSRIAATAKPTSHILSSNNCAGCHTAFGWKPVAQFNHMNVIGTCSSCHNGVQSIGKPANHIPTTAQCSTCHTVMATFKTATGGALPSNHIPFAATATCANCHTTSDFAAMPTLANIHLYAPSTSSNCAQCHGSTAPTFAIPAANFSIVGLPATHIPTTAACESCHVGAGSSMAATPVPNGAKFTNSAMSHSGLTTCVGCHGPTITGASFVGISKIVVMPPTSPVGATSHIPSATACESCHAGSMPAGFVPANATATAPGTKFAMPVPTTAQIHAGVTSGCSSCHESGDVWMSMSNYPISPTALTGSSSTQYIGFQTRPGMTASTFSVADAAHPATGDCGQCHGNTNYFDGTVKPANHIPVATSSVCTNCHTTSNFATLPTLSNIHAYAPSTSSGCDQCHGSAAPTFAIPAANFTIVGLPATHIPTTAACESCHVGAGSSIAATPVKDGAKFTNSAMSHAGLTTCAGCHGPTVTGASFVGVTKIIVMPPTTPVGASSHIPSDTICETCHVGSVPAGLVPANAVASVPGSKFAVPIPTTAQIHTGVTGGCTGCHESGFVWMSMDKYPIAPTALTGIATTQYTGFQTRPGTAASTFSVADAAHATTGDCVACHGNTNYFDGNVKPANHIPVATSSVCTNCHTTSNFATLPTLTNIHAYAPSTSSGCDQCHGSAAPTFAIPAANFTIVGLPATHIPTTAACESCHVGAGSSVAATPVKDGAKFTNSTMNHAGLTTCVGCHGPTVTGASFVGVTKIIVMPPTSPAGAGSHIPSVTTCETCHMGSMPAGSIAASAATSAPGSKFAMPVPTTAQIHAGITSGCTSCHESGQVWMDMGSYPIAPTTLSANAGTQYTGFQTRPGTTASTFSVADAAHTATGDCIQCHSSTNYFDGQAKPPNHIPFASTALCANCHTTSNMATLPTLTNIHAYAPSTSSNCAQCHGSAAASFAIPAANFSIVGLPATHIPTTAACESCHVGAGSSIAATPVLDGAKFTNSAMSHAGLTTCVGCHGPTITGGSFVGITKIIVQPPTSPQGPSSHIPGGTTCETCHMGSVPAGLIAANAATSAPGTKFAAPAPTTAQIHTGITSGCSSCHESGYNWMGANKYPISPATLSSNTGTQYIGFQTRPGTAASMFSVADAAHPATGDCGNCHGGNTNFWSGQALPSNHIPLVISTCATCHTTAGNNAVYTPDLTILHSAVTTTCSTCHADGKGPFAGAAGFMVVQMSTRGRHIPITNGGIPVECSGCHKTVTSFTGTIMSHAAIGDSGQSAAGNACDACHESTMRGSGYFFGLSNWGRPSANHYYCAPGGTTLCPNGGADCTTGCHEHSVSSKYAGVGAKTPRKTIMATGKPGAAVKPAAGSTTAVTATPTAGSPTAARPPGTTAKPTTPPRQMTLGVMPPLPGGMPATPGTATAGGLKFDHVNVAATCVSCHNGIRAQGKSANHPLSANDCDRCHTTSAWKPAVFDHATVLPGNCATCHNALQAVGKSSRHVVTTLSCDSCHYVLAWSPVKPPVVRKLVPPPRPGAIPLNKRSSAPPPAP